MTLLTHLNFPGNCAQAFAYYEQHLGGRIVAMMRQSQMPGSEPYAAGESDPVTHARLEVAGTTLIGNDVPPGYFQPIRSSYLYLSVDSVADVERIYEALLRGGEAFMPLQETFFAQRFSQLRDQFGTLWTLICIKPSA